MKHYLVTGGAGYIGTHVVQALLDAGHKVTIFDNLTSDIGHIDPRATLCFGDVCNYDEINQTMMHGFDGVFHFAAFKNAGQSMLSNGVVDFARNNITGTINVLNAMVRHKVLTFIFSSSAAVYGYPSTYPIDTLHPTVPVNFYGMTKLVIEEILHWYSKIEGIKYAALRYFNAAGYDLSGRIKGKERNPSNLLPIVMEVATGRRNSMKVFGNDYLTKDGTGVRDYIHVDDLTSAHLAAAACIENKEKRVTVNLGTEQGYSVLEVINKACEITGKQISYEIVDRRAGDADTVVASATEANRVLNWKAKHSDLETILRSMWNVYKDN